MVLNIDNKDQLDLLYGLVSEEISYLRHYILDHKSDDPSDLFNVRMDLKDLALLLDRLEDLKLIVATLSNELNIKL